MLWLWPQGTNAWAMLDAAAVKDVGGAEARRIRMGPGAANEGHCDNAIHTAKYNVFTFVPAFLLTMFSRVAYLYFLCQVEGSRAHVANLVLGGQGNGDTLLVCHDAVQGYHPVSLKGGGSFLALHACMHAC
jgi:hypothetical protein